MKKTIFTMILLAVVTIMSAQTLQFELDGTVFEEGETIVCTNEEYPMWHEFIQRMQVRNLTDNNLNVLIEKEVIQDLPGTTNSFCWGQCFGSIVIVSPDALTVNAHSINTSELSFHAVYEENAHGDLHMRYYAYDDHNPLERISINVIFSRAETSVEETPAFKIGQAYPNPATSQVHFDVNAGSNDNINVVVYNLLGQEVKSQVFSGRQNSINIAVDDFQPGIYFCSFQINNEVVKTEKFIVKR